MMGKKRNESDEESLEREREREMEIERKNVVTWNNHARTDRHSTYNLILRIDEK
jgi:hypothetical protein